MNEQQVKERVTALYDLKKDRCARDYLSDLENNFEEKAYLDIGDAQLIADVEQYREAAKAFGRQEGPYLTKDGEYARKAVRFTIDRTGWRFNGSEFHDRIHLSEEQSVALINLVRRRLSDIENETAWRVRPNLKAQHDFFMMLLVAIDV